MDDEVFPGEDRIIAVYDLAIDWSLMEDADIISAQLEEHKMRMKTIKGFYFRHIDDEIEEKNMLISEITRERERLWKSCQELQGGNLAGVDYSAVRVQGSGYHPGLIDVLAKIDGLDANLRKVIQERQELEEKRKKLLALYEAGDSVESQIFYLREVRGYTQERTAKTVGYSVRQVQRIEKKLKECNK